MLFEHYKEENRGKAKPQILLILGRQSWHHCIVFTKHCEAQISFCIKEL